MGEEVTNVIGILSPKGGVGKTTVVVNVGLAMHRLGIDALIVDCDLHNPNLCLHLGVFDFDITLQEALNRRLSAIEAIHIHSTGLKFIPAHLSLTYLNTDPSLLKDLFTEIKSKVLIDAPPGLGKGVFSVLESCDEVVVVATPFLPDLSATLKLIQIARDRDIKVKGIILNCTGREKYEVRKEEVEAITNAKVIQSVPWDRNVLRSLALKIPLVEYKPFSQASIAFYEIAAKLAGVKYKLARLLRLKGFFSPKGKIPIQLVKKF